MKLPAHITTEKEASTLILIVDKIGVIGENLAHEFSKDFLVVFASTRDLSSNNGKIIYIPFKRKIPKVPDNRYSKIFIVDDGNDVTRESAFSFIEKAKLTNCKVYFIGSTRNVDVEHADEITTSYKNAKVLIFGDLFDKNISFDKDSSISRFIKQVKKNGRIEVEGNGLNLNYPITFNDTIKLIIKASYLEIPQNVILLFYPHPITDISLANTFQKINPEVRVDFIKSLKNNKLFIPKGSQHAIGKYNIFEKLKELDLANEQKDEKDYGIISEKDSRNMGKFIKTILLFLFAFLFLILLPIITSSVYLFLGQQQLKEAKNNAERGDFQAALKKSENARTFFKVAEKTSVPLYAESKIFGKEKRAEEYNLSIKSGEDLSIAATDLFEGAVKLQDIYSGKSTNPKEDFSDTSSAFKSAYSTIQKINAQGQIPKEFKKEIISILPVIELFSNASEVLPDILGFDTEKTYLILIQDNTKLRPGGGSINSVGILTVKDAKIKKFEIVDVSTLDEKLKAHIEPPFELRRYLGAVHLYLKDSNFNPDFVKNAIAASAIYKLETEKEVDGVIGLDSFFIKNLLLAGKSVPILDSNLVINADNFYESIQKETDGKTLAQNKDLNALVLKSILLNKDNKTIPYVSLIEGIGDSVSQKHLLFAFKDPDMQNVFTTIGWSSTLTDNRKIKKDIINDYFGMSESNLGKNKINYLISRSVSKKVIVEKNGKINSVVTIAFKNSSQKDSSIGGEYKNYMRLILPEGSKIQEISVGGKVQKIIPAITDYSVYERKGFISPDSFEISQEEEGGKTIYGFFVMVAPESVKTIKVTYLIPYVVLNMNDLLGYSLLVYKQPGLDVYPFDLLFSVPLNMQVLPKNGASYQIIKDTEINYVFSQQ